MKKIIVITSLLVYGLAEMNAMGMPVAEFNANFNKIDKALQDQINETDRLAKAVEKFAKTADSTTTHLDKDSTDAANYIFVHEKANVGEVVLVARPLIEDMADDIVAAKKKIASMKAGKTKYNFDDIDEEMNDLEEKRDKIINALK